MCLIIKYWKTVLLLKFCFQTLKPHWNILYIMQYNTIYYIISVPDEIINKHSSLSFIWEQTVYYLSFIIFYLAEGSFWISLPVLNSPCASAQAWQGWEPVLNLEKAPRFPPGGCCFGSCPSQGTLRVRVRESWLQMWACSLQGCYPADFTRRKNYWRKKNINNTNTGHNRRNSLKYLKLGELTVLSLHHDILREVIIINLLLI